MAEQDKRPEATHRQRAALSTANGVGAVIGANGRPMAMITGTASDLVPTVQFGNLMVGPVQVTRWVEDDGLESVIESGLEVQKAAQAICGSERRIIQWALDPSKKIENPVTGAQMGPAAPAPTQAPAPPAPPQPPVMAPPAPSAAPPAGNAFADGHATLPGVPTPPLAQ